MLPDFNRLKVFYYVFLYNSVHKAAQTIHVTQSAVSQHIKNLEDELATPLFTRVKKRLLSTPAGEKLFNIIKPFVEELEAGIKYIDHTKKEPFGLLRIGAPVEFGSKYLMSVISDFSKKYPAVSFELELGHPDVLLQLVGEDKLDLAFSDVFSPKEKSIMGITIFDIKPVITEKLIMVCSSKYYRKNVNNHSLDTLIKCDHISYSKHAPAIRDWYTRHFRKSNISPKIILTVENVQAVISAVKNDMGLGIVPEYLLAKELKQKQIIHINTPKQDIINKISLVRLKDKRPSFTESAFLNENCTFSTLINNN